MAFEPGGYADKVGNRYEGRWVVKQLLRLLNEELLCITIEAVGDDERGVDLLVQRHDGTKQFQQCKARNGSHNHWAIADLNRRGILAAIRYQLDRHDCNEFALVTAVSGSIFGDICQSARDSSGNPEEFYQHQIKAIGEPRRKAFRQLCEYLTLDSEQEAERTKAFGYLRRTHVNLWADDQNSRDELLGRASILVTGKPEMIVSTLTEFAQNNLRNTLYANDIRNHLAGLGLRPRQLAHDARIAPAVKELQRQFEESIAPGLVAGKLIQREETEKVLGVLKEDGVVILHGSAGYGKTGVLYELTQILHRNGHGYLPVRLDRKELRNTTQQFGQDLGLPESPTLCMESLAGNRLSVLILDQLDALRWTSAHSANALEVCKSLVREVRNLRGLGKQIGVVLACRTFDLEHDPEIKNWLKESPGQKCQRIEVGPLPEETVKRVIEDMGGNFSAMQQRQKQILLSPQHLVMWAELARAGKDKDFHTSVQLMKQFWANRYGELAKAGVSSDQADGVISTLVAYMEKKGKISAPASLVADQPKEVDALHSHSILQTTGSQISFCHQSYLDFRIASRLLREIHQGKGTVRAWLGAKHQQSLFRREQLRQVLSLLCEDSPSDFVRSVQEILSNEEVRFHIKHLILELIGQLDQPSKDLCDYLLELLKDEYWKQHVLDTLCWGHVPYVQLLMEKNNISNWLDSDNQDDVKKALWLLRSIAEKIPDEVTELLEPFVERGGDWPQWILGSLCWKIEDDSDRMFELRLRLVRMGQSAGWADWKHWSAKHPLRTIQLIEAVASTWILVDIKEGNSQPQQKRQNRSRLEQWHYEDLKALKEGARHHAEYTWDLLMPHIERLTAIELEEYDTRLDKWQDGRHLHVEEGHTDIPRGIVKMVIEAGKSLARQDAGALLARTRLLQDSISPITQRILVEVYSALLPERADEALRWLLADSNRLSLGSGYNEPEWMPAVRLIQALSPHCSEELFRELANTIIHYHSPNEKRMAKYYIATWRKGYFGDYWGRAQHFLLPALCPTRRSGATTGLIGVLERKFAEYSEWRFLKGGHMTSGWVGSPLPTKYLHRISDNAWLEIVSNESITDKDSFNHKQISPDHVAESSVLHFSRDLRTIASRFPERFGRLALQFPRDVHTSYMAAILAGIKQTKPIGIPEDEKTAWQPASIETIEAVLEKCVLGDESEVASDFCWLIHDRADEQWSEHAIQHLLHYATEHPDPDPAKLNVCPSDKKPDVNTATVHSLVNNALNCVRGVAALAIGELLRHHPDWLNKLRGGIERLVRDPHPAVRVAAIDALLPVLNIDKNLAIEWFCTASEGDGRIPASRSGVYFFNCGMETQAHCEKLTPITIQMLNSPYQDVAQQGAEEVAARWLFYGIFEEELTQCCKGRIPQRKGVAKIAARFVLEREYTDKCRKLLLCLFDDPESEVRAEIRHMFRDGIILTIPGASEFIRTYVRSQTYADSPFRLFYALEEYSGSLIPYAEVIFGICGVFSGPLRDSSRDMSTAIAHDASHISPLLLRLYEQSKSQGDSNITDRCLDAWDRLFENRVGMTRDMTKAIEQ